MSQRIRIFYFSGTGNTRIAATIFHQNLSNNNQTTVTLIPIEEVLADPATIDLSNLDLIGVGFPIHCFNVPRIIFEFLNKLPKASLKVFTFMTAADSFMLNHAAAFFVRQKLMSKGYDVLYQSLIMMPSNIFFQQAPEAIDQIFCLASQQIQVQTNDIERGKTRTLSPGIVLCLIAFFTSMVERGGARIFGKDLAVSSACNVCRLCVQKCPVKNIFIKKNRIAFHFRCLACLRCVYLCPQKAIMPRLEKFAILKNGYDPEKQWTRLQARFNKK